MHQKNHFLVVLHKKTARGEKVFKKGFLNTLVKNKSCSTIGSVINNITIPRHAILYSSQYMKKCMAWHAYYLLYKALIYNHNSLSYMLNENPEYHRILSSQTCSMLNQSKLFACTLQAGLACR